MKQLTIKELSPYLPYGVNIQWLRILDNTKQISPLTISDYDYLIEVYKGKPILCPIDALKEDELITIGRIICNNDEMHQAFAIDMASAWIKGGMSSVMPLPRVIEVTDYLFSIKADVYGLIPQGLAIDINTLQNEN